MPNESNQLGPEKGNNLECSYLSDATDMDVAATNTSAALAARSLSFLPDASFDSGEVESSAIAATSRPQRSRNRSLASESNNSELHDKTSSTMTPSHQGEIDESYLSGDGELEGSEDFESDSNASTRGNHHVIDQYSFLSDAGSFGDSRNFETNNLLSTLDHVQVINQSFLPDASLNSDTIIKMESSQSSAPGSGSFPPDISGAGKSTSLAESSSKGKEGVKKRKIHPDDNPPEASKTGESRSHPLTETSAPNKGAESSKIPAEFKNWTFCNNDFDDNR